MSPSSSTPPPSMGIRQFYLTAVLEFITVVLDSNL
jgi:hypothetical protein